MKRLIGLAILGVAVAGCAPAMYLKKDSVSQEQANRDEAQCEYEAEVHARSTTPGLDSFGMELDRLQRKRELKMACLKARGYRLVAAPQK